MRLRAFGARTEQEREKERETERQRTADALRYGNFGGAVNKARYQVIVSGRLELMNTRNITAFQRI